jgi:adenine-specific DNA-methyltransferase
MENQRAKFQELLKELFQFDRAELDFGIYRILNHKRDVIQRFIEHDLFEGVTQELNRGALLVQTEAASELATARQVVLENLTEDALDAQGTLAAQYRNTKAGRDYLAAQTKASGAQGRDVLEAAIYNHLYSFFSRYYDSGDFMSKRRYSKRERYAVPYNGEEVYLHWANKDQYYVKTIEHFRDYSYKHRDVTVRFKVKETDPERDDTTGDKRFFLPRYAEVSYDEATHELAIPFDYRPLDEQETIKYGKTGQQETVISEAVDKIPPKFEGLPAVLLALATEKRRDNKDRSVSLLEHHLIRYAAKNTFDYFVHKDLQGFLMKELDYYLKNEVLNLDDLDAAGEAKSDGWFQMMRVIRAIGAKIIAFLAQIENLQKRLFEKRKFVTEVNYLVTLASVPAEFYTEVAACDDQWNEWKDLFHIDEDQRNLFSAGNRAERRCQFLQSHPTLVVDTRHFKTEFTARLLAAINDLDEQTDGLLIHAENFQALGLIQTKYRRRVKSIYIDPPYNTSASRITYKNDYKNSSWLALLSDRVRLGKSLLDPDTGVLCCTIDDVEQRYLSSLIETCFQGLAGTVCIRVKPSGRPIPRGFAISHEYAIFAKMNSDFAIARLGRSDKQLARFKEKPDAKGRYFWELLRKAGSNSSRERRPTMFYPLYLNKRTGKFRIPDMTYDEPNKRFIIHEKPSREEVAIWPKQDDGSDGVWYLGCDDGIQEVIGELRADAKEDGTYDVYYRRRPNEGVQPATLWWDSKYSATEHGTALLKHLFGEKEVFSYPKSIYATEDCLRVSGVAQYRNSLVTDYFGGSGTTGHAVINLNREDGGRRKFILVESGGYFDTVLLPRIKKVIFTPEWKDGRPKRMATATEAKRSPRVVKYVRLESYEDSLNNIAFAEGGGQQALQFEDYVLNYMLDFETRASESMLNIKKLQNPFSYTLRIHDDGETREETVDLAETFNYLIGLNVKTRRAYDDGGRRYLVYRGMADEKDTVVIWRETKNWGIAEFEADRQFVAKQHMTDGANVVYANCGSRIPNARSLDQEFKRLMFAPVEL